MRSFHNTITDQYCLPQVISAFDVPKMLYEPVRKCFYQAATPPKLLAAAEVHALLLMAIVVCKGCGLPAGLHPQQQVVHYWHKQFRTHRP